MDFELLQCSVSAEEHQARLKACLAAGQELECSLRAHLLGSCINDLTTEIPTVLLPNITMANDERWAKLPFGAVNTIEASACVALVTKYMTDYFGYDIPFMNVVEELVAKGYRQWKLANRAKTLAFPTISLKEIQGVFPEDKAIQACKSLEELYNVAGNPVGIGGSAYALDQLAVMLADNRILPYVDTRIRSLVDVVRNLRNCIPIPLRVNNSTYHNNSKEGGHYVVLTGVHSGTATVLDSSLGVHKLPVNQLFRSIIKDPGLIAAWDFSHAQWA